MRRLQFGSNRSYGIFAFNILLEDKKKGKIIPESFPGTVMIVEDIDNNTLLHPEYRKYNDGYDADFEYFVTRLLAKLNPLRTNYRSRQKEDLISEIFTTSDEAFVLFVLYNEMHCWEAQMADIATKALKGRQLVKEKRFCNGKSGKRDAWSEEGMDLYKKLLVEVHVRRQETKQFEVEWRDRLKSGSSDPKFLNKTQGSNEGEDGNQTKKWVVAEEQQELMNSLVKGNCVGV